MAIHEMMAAPAEKKSLWDKIVNLFVSEEKQAQKRMVDAQKVYVEKKMKQDGYRKETVGDRLSNMVTGKEPDEKLGKWVRDAEDKPLSVNNNNNTVPISESSSAAGGGGGGNSAMSTQPLTYYTADELAKRFGIVNDYATILKELQGATNKKFDETETTMKRAESANLRGQESAYNQYLQDLRSRAANAVSSGATKGTMSANALASILGFQESNREGINTLNDLMYTTAQERGTALATDVTTARQQANEIGQYLGNLSTSMDTNNINKYAAELAANAQTRAASISAGGATSAARVAANSAYEQILNSFTNDYINKGYGANAAKNLAYTDYANLIKSSYAK
jgi:hypothetical protein